MQRRTSYKLAKRATFQTNFEKIPYHGAKFAKHEEKMRQVTYFRLVTLAE